MVSKVPDAYWPLAIIYFIIGLFCVFDTLAPLWRRVIFLVVAIVLLAFPFIRPMYTHSIWY